jgi:hypothetical protein
MRADVSDSANGDIGPWLKAGLRVASVMDRRLKTRRRLPLPRNSSISWAVIPDELE